MPPMYTLLSAPFVWMPSSRCNSVDLPWPERPMMARISPAGSSKFTSCSKRLLPANTSRSRTCTSQPHAPLDTSSLFSLKAISPCSMRTVSPAFTETFFCETSFPHKISACPSSSLAFAFPAPGISNTVQSPERLMLLTSSFWSRINSESSFPLSVARSLRTPMTMMSPSLS